MIIKILGIYGSPRAGGNTDMLLDSFLAGCAEAGADVRRLYLRELDFGPCAGCGGCSATGECVMYDGMKGVYPLLADSVGIVLASPIFFYGVTAQAKAFIDRMQPLYVRKYVMGKKGLNPGKRKGFFISAGATGGERLFDGARLTMKYFYDALDAGYAGDILHRGVEGKGGVADVAGALNMAFEKGKWFDALAR